MRTVIVVEDEALIRMLAAEVLEEAGFDVMEFTNAADAMTFCREPANEVAAVFTDINMPGELDGLDVAELVIRTRPNAAVIVTSGRYGLKPAGLSPDVTFLPKPWTAASLLTALEKAAG